MMIPTETLKEMEEFREANRKYISHQWNLDNKPFGAASSSSRNIGVYTRKLEPPPSGRPHKLSTSTVVPSSHSSWWSIDDREGKRQRRVVKYKTYAVEGKMKASLKSGFRWVKNKYSAIVHGY